MTRPMTPAQHTAAQQALTDLRATLATAYNNHEVTDHDADEFLRMLNSLALFLSLKPTPQHHREPAQ